MTLLTKLFDRAAALTAISFDRARRSIPLSAMANARMPLKPRFNGTVRSLIACYQTDPDSSFHKLRYASKRYATTMCARIERDHGDADLSDLTARDFKRWHEEWIKPANPLKKPKIAMGHALIGQTRTICNFGASILENKHAARCGDLLSKMRFPMAKPRSSVMTAEWAIAIRREAHRRGFASIALAQAMAYDGMYRQKDIIGELVPMNEPGMKFIVVETRRGPRKWMRGFTCDEISRPDLILTHITSKRQKEHIFDLTLAPMIMEELNLMGEIPLDGPLIINEKTGKPWAAQEFRKIWREIARAVGVPDNVNFQDSRAGGISEATDAGADMEKVRHAATHTNISTTERYSRNALAKTSDVMRLRVQHRTASLVPALPPQRAPSTARRKANPTPRKSLIAKRDPKQTAETA